MKIRTLLAAATLLSVITLSCSREIKQGNISGGRIILSFDDNNTENWNEWLSLLDSGGIKATFYISSYHTLTLNQKEKLCNIQAHGHEIAYHSTNHTDLVKLYSKNNLRYAMNNEIKPDLELMRKDGDGPKSFAYPYGQHDFYLDRQLLVWFTSLRGVCNQKKINKAFTQNTGKQQVLYAQNIDAAANLTDEELENMIALAREKNSAVSLYSHEIENPGYTYSKSAARLRFLIHLAKKYNMPFVTTQEITR
jgi:peptidoglycan-N-acetylglucosamine deacetylase